MSAAELLPTIQLLPRAEKEQLYRFLADELARKEVPAATAMFVPPPEDHCPYSPTELLRMFEDESAGASLSEIWRKLERT